MIFDKVLTFDLAEKIYNAIYGYNSNFFKYATVQDINAFDFKIILSCTGGEKVISPVLAEILNTDFSDLSITQNEYIAQIVLKYHAKRWDNILESLHKQYDVFSRSKKQSVQTVGNTSETVTNFDIYANESIDSQIKANDKENTINLESELNNNTVVTDYNLHSFDEAFRDFIKSTKYNIIDIIIKDIINFLCCDVYE